MTAPDIQAAASAISLAADVVAAAVGSARTRPDSEDQQVLLYDLAHAASAVEISRSLIDYGAKGDVEGRLACAFIADAIADLAAKLYGREALWAVEPGALDAARDFVAAYRDPDFVAGLAFETGPSHLSDDFEMVADTFRRFATDKIAPVAEHIHRDDTDIPEEIIAGLAGSGASGCRCPRSTAGSPAAARATTWAW